MIYFIYGPSGSGKTHAIFSQLRTAIENKKRAFVLVPEQETVAVERKILEIFPPDAQLGLEVLNFSRLCNRIFRTFGGLSYDVASNPTKALLMWNNLRELSPLLEEYKFSDVYDFSLVEKMMSAAKELKAYNVSPQKLDASGEKIDKSSALYPKLRDISLIYAAYVNRLHDQFSDSADDISIAVDMLKEHNFFKGANVYIDSFAGYTEQEFDMISKIFSLADNVYITLGLPSPDASDIHFESLRATDKKLKKLLSGKAHEDIVLSENQRTESHQLKYLAENIWRFEAEPDCNTEGVADVFSYICETPYSEAELVASEISRLAFEGMRYSDIAIIARDADSYRGILDVALKKYNIPFFMSEKTDLINKPLSKFILSALKIKESGWRAQNVIAHLKSGFSDIDQFDIDLFEDYVYTWKINGNKFFEPYWTMNPDGFSGRISERGKRILSVANSVREKIVTELSLFFAKLDAADNVADMCRATVEFLQDANITEKVKAQYERDLEYGNKKAAAEDLQLYSLSLEILYQLSAALGEERLSPSEFSAALTLMFSCADIGTIPTSADEVVIGSASMLRASDVKCAFIIGLNEGDFPRAVKDNGIFTDAERAALAEIDVKLSDGADIRSAEELYFIYRAVSLPRKSLILTAPAVSSTGKSKNTSIVFDRVEALLSVSPIKESSLSPIAKIWSPQTAREQFLKIKDQNDALLLNELFPSLASDVSAELPISQSECRASEDVIRRILGENMYLSSSRLESYVKCGFNYYCSYVLKLRESKRAVFELNNMGSFVHAVLELFLREITKDNKIDLSLSDEQINDLLERSIDSHLTELLGKDYAISNRTKHLFMRLKRLSLLLINNVIKEFKSSSFVPASFELSIGRGDDAIPPITFKLADGSTLSINGQIDRVDTYKEGEDVYVRVVDYKSGHKVFSLDEVREGLNMQMLIYLFSICKSDSPKTKAHLGCAEDGKLLPAGIQYLSSGIKTLSFDKFTSDEKIQNDIESNLKRTGLFLEDINILEAFNSQFDPAFIGGVKISDGVPSGKALASAEGFDMIYEELSDTIIKIAQSLRDGYADAKPLIRSSSPCNYCKMSSICRSAQKTFIK